MNTEEKVQCSHCSAWLERRCFPPSALKGAYAQKRCTKCGNAANKMSRHKEPLITTYRSIRRREKRAGKECTLSCYSDVRAVFERHKYRCAATGVCAQGPQLTLIRVRAEEPLGINNAVPVLIQFARHHACLPESLADDHGHNTP